MMQSDPQSQFRRYLRASWGYWLLLLLLLAIICMQWPLLVLSLLAFRAVELWLTWRLLSRWPSASE